MTVVRKSRKKEVVAEEVIYANTRLRKEIEKKNEAAAKKKKLSVKVVRKDEAVKSNRGNRGGNLGQSR